MTKKPSPSSPPPPPESPPSPDSHQQQAKGVALPYRLRSQYLQDLSFENPGILKRIKGDAGGTIKHNTNWHITNEQLPGEGFLYQAEVRLTLSAYFESDTQEKIPCMVLEISMAAVVEIATNLTDKDTHQKILRIDIPHLLYPYIRFEIDQIMRNGGYPPMHIPPLNFFAAYKQYADSEKNE